MAEREIQCERRGVAGCIRLDRPRALNALTPGMVLAMAEALDRFEADPAVERVVISGAGERAFCAGGDIRLMHDLGRAGDHAAQLAFWRDEYRLNLRLAQCPKPVVALIDGIVMGGGVGVSVHATYRVAGGRYLFAMPEVAIGFFPDVGATYVLPRLPHQAGVWLALTGARIGAGDAAALGLATHVVPSAGFAALEAALELPGDTAAILATHAVDPPKAAHAADLPLIAEAFAGHDLAEVMASLEAHADSAFACDTLATLRRVSPTSLALALRQMRAGADLSLTQALQLEFRIVSRICRAHDFYEGVRALIVDKDNRPVWTPTRIEDLPVDVTNAYTAPLGADELTFPKGRD
jgi:enoyl-CoA hydratase